MVGFVKSHTIFNAINPKRLQTLTPINGSLGYHHFGTNPSFDSPLQKISQQKVAVFWDLDNKPPKSFPPYDAAVRLKKAAASFGVVRHLIAYANRHAFSYVPVEVREERKKKKVMNQSESMRICRVCGRRFYNGDKLINHFKQIHEREHAKRLSQIESARGNMRVKLVGKYSMKMEKYKNAARDVLTPKVGYGLADELRRAGFWVRTVENKPQAADIALRNHMVEMMDRRWVECVILVSDDSDFVGVLKEARERCLKTVVVGDTSDGALKRAADASYSWQEIMMGKAKKEAVSVVGRWKDRDVLKRLEWSYNPETDRKLYRFDDEDDVDSEGSDVDGLLSGEVDDKNDTTAWWKLEPDSGGNS